MIGGLPKNQDGNMRVVMLVVLVVLAGPSSCGGGTSPANCPGRGKGMILLDFGC